MPIDMSAMSLLLLALGLAMDAVAVAAARGIAAAQVRARDALAVAVLFGGAQAAMPLAGWWLGDQLGPTFAAFDHWVAFVIFCGLGAKLLVEARRDAEVDEPTRAAEPRMAFAWATLGALALATSIDAFAAGVALPAQEVDPALAAAIIGAVTAVLSGVGVYAGRRFGALLGSRLERVGGVVLIGLGIKVLLTGLLTP